MEKVATVSQQFRENQYAQYAVFGAGAALVTLAIGATFARMVSPQVRFGSIFTRRFVAVTMVMGASTVAAGAFLKLYGAQPANPEEVPKGDKPIPKGLEKMPQGPLDLTATEGKDLKTVAQEAANKGAKILDPVIFHYKKKVDQGTFWNSTRESYVTATEDRKIKLANEGNLCLLANSDMQGAATKLETIFSGQTTVTFTQIIQATAKADAISDDDCKAILQDGATLVCLGEDTTRLAFFRLLQVAETEGLELERVSVIPVHIDKPDTRKKKVAFETAAQGVFSFAS